VKKRNYINPSNLEYLDAMWDDFEKNPEKLEPSWQHFFEGVEFGKTLQEGVPHEALSKSYLESKVGELIAAYRNAGHLMAHTNPLFEAPEEHPLLKLSRFGLNEENLNEVFDAGQTIGLKNATLKEIILQLQETYCRSIGAEFTHLQRQEPRDWLSQKMEETQNKVRLSDEERRQLLKRISQAEGFENYLHTRYVAQKRFSLEGGEGLIPFLDELINEAAQFGSEQVVVGMAHRGRLNVLTNIFQKKARYIFSEFDDNYDKSSLLGSGDVKYHKGYSADITTKSKKSVHLSLAYNPSHLEFVGPVVEGVAYTKQQSYPLSERQRKVMPIIIHGDASIAGQGVVYESINFSKVDGYSTGGSIHIVINNQVGFTTSPTEARSTTYATDIAKMLEAPVFHVNGDDPEALVWVAKLAAEYRSRFGESVFIDIICYRRHGHNEGDEPNFTQPLLYSAIKNHQTPRTLYAQKLLDAGVLNPVDFEKIKLDIEKDFENEQEISRRENIMPHASSFEGKWMNCKPLKKGEETSFGYYTFVKTEKLNEIAQKISEIPSNFTPNPKVAKFMETRKQSLDAGKNLDWATCEALAFGSLLLEGHAVRLSGQDAQRGTFTHRHSVLSDAKSGVKFCPLKNLSPQQAPFTVFNSTLSETAVMAFEYGCSLSDPTSLVIWEAQFGDFANGAQVIIDQFIASSEIKWQRASGLVLYLPHGQEGQGPEHSSARLERFLQLCAERNLTVCNLSTPGNLFHALRRQLKRSYRKPLVIMTPKSLLRYAPSFSDMKVLSEGNFQKIIPETELDYKNAEEIILCSGKVYYDLLEHRQKNNLKTPLFRLEQFYPLPHKEISSLIAGMPKLKRIRWAQEEAQNQGAWPFIYMEWTGASGSDFASDLEAKIGRKIEISYVGRKAAAAPAVGSTKVHQKNQAAIMEMAFAKK
jgi:2-oxoglutarate dehydrogenase E1 component